MSSSAQLPRSWKSSISRLRRSYPCGDMLLGLSTEPVGLAERVPAEFRLRCEPAGIWCWIAVLGRTGCFGAAIAAEAVARTNTSESANFELVNMACLRCASLIRLQEQIFQRRLALSIEQGSSLSGQRYWLGHASR